MHSVLVTLTMQEKLLTLVISFIMYMKNWIGFILWSPWALAGLDLQNLYELSSSSKINWTSDILTTRFFFFPAIWFPFTDTSDRRCRGCNNWLGRTSIMLGGFSKFSSNKYAGFRSQFYPLHISLKLYFTIICLIILMNWVLVFGKFNYAVCLLALNQSITCLFNFQVLM